MMEDYAGHGEYINLFPMVRTGWKPADANADDDPAFDGDMKNITFNAVYLTSELPAGEYFLVNPAA